MKPADGSRKKPGSDPGADSRLGALAGGIAHDLNTVITTIYGYSEMALESLDGSPEAAENIQRIIGAADRARMLTGQLLDLSRHAAREKVPVRVAAVLADTIDFIRPSVPEGIRIIRRVSAPDAYVNAVPAQLFRVFLNLIMNAIQAMTGQGGTLTVTLGCRENEKALQAGGQCMELHIRFSDTGKGMDEALKREIFKPFVSAGREHGTGLGLTVVADAIREMGGTITVLSEPGAGTVFDIIIPGAFFGTLPEKH
jgi:signal transduction histidine kinase